MTAVFLGKFSTFGGLLNRNADASTGKVEVDDLDPEFFTWCDHLLWRVDVVRRHFRNMHEAFDAVAHLYESTEWNELRDATINKLAHFVRAGEFLPWVLLCGLQREADALAAHVDIENLNCYFVANGNN